MGKFYKHANSLLKQRRKGFVIDRSFCYLVGRGSVFCLLLFCTENIYLECYIRLHIRHLHYYTTRDI